MKQYKINNNSNRESNFEIYEIESRHIENPSFLVIVSIDFDRNLFFISVSLSPTIKFFFSYFLKMQHIALV
jgi:hypothetical protein